MIPSRFAAPNEVFTLVLLLLLIAVIFPTWGMYKRTSKLDNNARWRLWTATMLTMSILLPVIGPVILWLLYAGVVSRDDDPVTKYD